MRYKVAVSIINYNSSEHTLACLRSIVEHTARELSYQIVVIDNASSEEDLERLEAGFPRAEHISLYRSGINLGFAGGHMLAVGHCDADYLYVLNNDCLLLNDNLSVLSDFMAANSSCGLCIGQLYEQGGGIGHSFAYLPAVLYYLFGTGFARLLDPARYPKRKKYTAPVRVPYVSGAAMFFDLTKFREVGGLDTAFFLYCEEEDIAIRLAERGYDIYMVPGAGYIHYGGGSTRKSYEIMREYYISLFLLFRKHYSLPSRAFFTLYFFFKNLKKGFRDRRYLKIALFLLNTDKPRHSLRHGQNERFREQ